MKKIALILTLLLPVIAFSQQFNGGLVLGMSTSDISGDNHLGPNKIGVYSGGFVNFYFTDKMSIQTELDFVQKGSRQNPDSSNQYQSYLLRLNYIEMPIVLKYDLSPRWVGEVGLSNAYLISSYEAVNESTSLAHGVSFKPYDLSFNAGIHFRLLENVNLNIRFSHSLLPVRKHMSGQSYRWDKGQYNQLVCFNFNYIIYSRVFRERELKYEEDD